MKYYEYMKYRYNIMKEAIVFMSSKLIKGLLEQKKIY